MKICFAGTRYGLPETRLEELKNIIIQLITQSKDEVEFYCSEYGKFERQARRIVSELKKDYPQIKSYWVNPFYRPQKFNNEKAGEEYAYQLSRFENEYKQHPTIRQQEFEKFKHYAIVYYLYNDDYKTIVDFYDDMIIYELDNVPHKARIIESNKRKVDDCDVVITHCPAASNQSRKIRDYAIKKHKKVIDMYRDE